MANFKIANKLTGGNEGGYVDDPDDAGGETYCGITRKNFPHWEGWSIVDKHKPLHKGAIIAELNDKKDAFYKHEFWDKLKGDSNPDQDLANQVYDMAVTSGIGTALELLNAS